MSAIVQSAIPRPDDAPAEVIGIAASAGGLRALMHVLGELDPGFPAPILVALHRGAAPAAMLVDVLGSGTGLQVREAAEDERPRRGTVYVAPGGRHLELGAPGRLTVRRSGRINFVCPCADLLFASLARCYGARTLAVILSGEGRDGAEGVKSVRARGGFVLVQDRFTSEHFGMPCSAIETRKADLVLPLQKIAYALEVLTARSPANSRDRQPDDGIRRSFRVS
jgi:two-component system chemotaxis response regulator CheB